MLVSSYKNLQETLPDSALDVRSRIQNRRARSGVLAITSLEHTCDHLAVLNSPPAQSAVRPGPHSLVKAKGKHANRLKLDRLLVQRLRHGLLPLPSSLPWKGHISTL